VTGTKHTLIALTLAAAGVTALPGKTPQQTDPCQGFEARHAERTGNYKLATELYDLQGDCLLARGEPDRAKTAKMNAEVMQGFADVKTGVQTQLKRIEEFKPELEGVKARIERQLLELSKLRERLNK
jgi:hypothetical protein